MISWMFINVNAIVIILLNIFKKYEKIKKMMWIMGILFS